MMVLIRPVWVMFYGKVVFQEGRINDGEYSGKTQSSVAKSDRLVE